jgi:hypothetical protein
MQLIPYFLIAAGLLSTLALFMTLKREIRGQAHRQRTRIEAMAVRLKEAERPPQIIVPRREVELLIRVQSIGKTRAAGAGSD